MAKPLDSNTTCTTNEDAIWLLKTLKFRKGGSNIYYRKRKNYDTTALKPFEHDKATLEGKLIKFYYSYKQS